MTVVHGMLVFGCAISLRMVVQSPETTANTKTLPEELFGSHRLVETHHLAVYPPNLPGSLDTCKTDPHYKLQP